MADRVGSDQPHCTSMNWPPRFRLGLCFQPPLPGGERPTICLPCLVPSRVTIASYYKSRHLILTGRAVGLYSHRAGLRFSQEKTTVQV